MNTFILTSALGLMLIYYILIRKKELIHPVVLFNVMFFLNSLFYMIWVPQLPDIEYKTVYITLIFCATFSFFVGNKFKLKKHERNDIKKNPKFIYVSKDIRLLFLLFSFISFVIYFIEVAKIVVSLGANITSINSIMVAYSGLSKFSTENVSIVFYAKILKEIVYSAGFVLGFIEINNYFSIGKKGINPLGIFNIIISGLITLLIGSRSELVRLALALIAIYYAYILIFKSKKKKQVAIIKILLIFIIVLLTFKSFGNLLGRENSRRLSETLLMYIGGPLKNLDLAINSGKLISEFPGQITFAYQYRSLANMLDNSKLLYDTSLPFVVMHGIDLGNVYTALAVYYVDFGVVFSLFMLAIMGIITSILYRRFINSIQNIQKPIWILIFAFLAYNIIMEGFSEKFYGAILSFNLYRHFIYFYILFRIFTKKQYRRLI